MVFGIFLSPHTFNSGNHIIILDGDGLIEF